MENSSGVRGRAAGRQGRGRGPGKVCLDRRTQCVRKGVRRFGTRSRHRRWRGDVCAKRAVEGVGGRPGAPIVRLDHDLHHPGARADQLQGLRLDDWRGHRHTNGQDDPGQHEADQGSGVAQGLHATAIIAKLRRHPSIGRLGQTCCAFEIALAQLGTCSLLGGVHDGAVPASVGGALTNRPKRCRCEEARAIPSKAGTLNSAPVLG